MTTTSTVTAEDLLAGVRELIAEQQVRTGTPGVAIGVVAGGRTAAEGMGTTSVVDGRPVTPRTLFRLCSITKPFLATLAMTVVAEGTLDLDEPIAARLPGFALRDPSALRSLTLRHLLLHTSGLACELPIELDAFGQGDDALARLIRQYGTLAQYAPVGSYWGYCNAGYWLAGHLLARLTGQTFETAMHERVLAPLGMRQTTTSTDDAILHRVALPHVDDDAKCASVGPFAYPRARVPSGGLISSVDGLLRFAALQLENLPPGSTSPLDASIVASMHEPVVPCDGSGLWQGLGWQVTVTPDRPNLVRHDGSYPGYVTDLFLVPDLGIGVTVLTNSDNGGMVCRTVREAVLARVSDIRPSAPVFTEVPDEALRRFAGRYLHPDVDHSDVVVADGELILETHELDGEITASRYRPIADTEFVAHSGPSTGKRLAFLTDAAGDQSIIRVGLRLGMRARPR